MPDAGLCNRMRAIDGAAALAQQANVALRVVWWATWDLNAPYERLFDTSSLDFELVERRIPALLGQKLLDRAEQLRALIPAGPLVVTGDATSPGTFDAEAVLDAARSGRDVRIRTVHKLVDHPTPFSMFSPSNEVQTRVDAIPALQWSGSDESTRPVGVHIRRTDSKLSIEKSPMSAFERLMDDELATNPEQRFFVATDDKPSFAYLQERYGDAVSEYEKRSYARDDPEGIVDAAVDFWGLTRCRKIIGSFYSSFTETAASKGGADLVMAIDD